MESGVSLTKLVGEDDPVKCSVPSPTHQAAMLEVRLDQIRDEIIEYRNAKYADLHFIVAGPTGTGKSSLLRTWYRALHNTADLSHELREYTVVNHSTLCEGTTNFKSVEIKSGLEVPGTRTSGIIAHDSRGQVFLDIAERKQLDLMMAGKINDNSVVKQREYRHAYLLWEFWKKGEDIWPADLVTKHLPSVVHGLLLLFDGSSSDPVSEGDASFYLPFISECCSQGYLPMVALTRVDEVERMPIALGEKGNTEFIMHARIDERISQVCRALKLPRRQVFFIENYHDRGCECVRNATIEFNSLKLLKRLCEITEEQTIAAAQESSCCIS